MERAQNIRARALNVEPGRARAFQFLVTSLCRDSFKYTLLVQAAIILLKTFRPLPNSSMQLKADIEPIFALEPGFEPR